MTTAIPAMAWFWQTWLAAIVFVFPIPHTIALRNLLLLVGLLALLATLRHARRPLLRPTLKPAAWALVATTAWLALQSVTVAPAPTLALDNLRGDWIVPLLTAGLVPVGERDYHSSLSGFLLALVLGERLAGQYAGAAAAQFAARPGWAGLVVALLADTALRVRNGTLVSMLLLATATATLSRRQPRFLVALLVVAALGGASVALDKRWSGLQESLAVGWNSDSLYWQNWDPAVRPATPSGMPLEESAYARAAWAHQAARIIAAHPLGLGFGRDGFGRAIAAKYGFKGMVSSHSGWLDFALGAGLPGLALLLVTAGLAIRGGWRQFRRHDDAAGLMLCFLVGGYLLRCLLDGHFSGWRLGLFAFLCGVLIAAMKNPQRQT